MTSRAVRTCASVYSPARRTAPAPSSSSLTTVCGLKSSALIVNIGIPPSRSPDMIALEDLQRWGALGNDLLVAGSRRSRRRTAHLSAADRECEPQEHCVPRIPRYVDVRVHGEH